MLGSIFLGDPAVDLAATKRERIIAIRIAIQKALLRPIDQVTDVIHFIFGLFLSFLRICVLLWIVSFLRLSPGNNVQIYEGCILVQRDLNNMF